MNNDTVQTFLSEEEVKNIEEVTYRIPDSDLTAFRVFEFRTIANPNAETDSYDVADTDEGSAKLLRNLSEAPGLMVTKQRVAYNLFLEGVSWELKFSDIANSRTWGKPLDTEVIERATQAVNQKLNDVAYKGDAEFGVTGILEATGVTAITGTDIDGMTTVASNFVAYFNSLPAVFRKKPYSLVMADKEYVKLTKFGNTYNDKSIINQILDAIPNLIEIVSETTFTAGTVLSAGGTVANGVAMFIPKDKGLVRVPIAKSPNTTMQTNTAYETIKGVANARGGPVEVIFPTSIGKITGLDS